MSDYSPAEIWLVTNSKDVSQSESKRQDRSMERKSRRLTHHEYTKCLRVAKVTDVLPGASSLDAMLPTKLPVMLLFDDTIAMHNVKVSQSKLIHSDMVTSSCGGRGVTTRACTIVLWPCSSSDEELTLPSTSQSQRPSEGAAGSAWLRWLAVASLFSLFEPKLKECSWLLS